MERRTEEKTLEKGERDETNREGKRKRETESEERMWCMRMKLPLNVALYRMCDSRPPIK